MCPISILCKAHGCSVWYWNGICKLTMHPLQVVTAKVVSLGVSGENSSQESSSDSSPGSPSHHHHQQQQQQQQHHHHPVVGPNHEAENLLPSVVNACVFVCLCVGVCVFVHMCRIVTTITCFPKLHVFCTWMFVTRPPSIIFSQYHLCVRKLYVVPSEYL